MSTGEFRSEADPVSPIVAGDLTSAPVGGADVPGLAAGGAAGSESERSAPADADWAWTPARFFNVVVRLSDGETVEVASFPSSEEAEARATEVVAELDRREPGKWPRLGFRYIRPETVLSVDIVEERAMRWAGSGERAQWAHGGSARRDQL